MTKGLGWVLLGVGALLAFGAIYEVCQPVYPHPSWARLVRGQTFGMLGVGFGALAIYAFDRLRRW